MTFFSFSSHEPLISMLQRAVLLLGVQRWAPVQGSPAWLCAIAVALTALAGYAPMMMLLQSLPSAWMEYATIARPQAPAGRVLATLGSLPLPLVLVLRDGLWLGAVPLPRSYPLAALARALRRAGAGAALRQGSPPHGTAASLAAPATRISVFTRTVFRLRDQN